MDRLTQRLYGCGPLFHRILKINRAIDTLCEFFGVWWFLFEQQASSNLEG